MKRPVKTKLLRYVRESICACGFPALSPSVPVGTVYKALSPAVGGFDFICGGCGKENQVKAIKVRRFGQLAKAPQTRDKPGWMPIDIFEEV